VGVLMENSLGKLIGSGGTANVYEWTNNKVIKVFKPHVPVEVIKYEEYMGRMLNETELHIPKYIETIELNGKLSIVYERAYGRQMVEILIETTNKSIIAENFARVHYEIHQCYIEKLPTQNSMIHWRLSRMRSNLGTDIKRIEDLINSLPIENKLCHGDFHPLNILVDCDKYTVLDWNDCCLGNPILDVGWSYLTLNSPSIEAVYGQVMANTIKDFSNEYLKYYCKYANVDKREILEYLPLAAMRRLDDNISCETDISKYENNWLRNIIKTKKDFLYMEEDKNGFFN
jgi:thiamine kinase-like enzyme